MTQVELAKLREGYEKQYGFHVRHENKAETSPGLSKETVCEISRAKHEPGWMLELRLRAYEVFLKKPMPEWGADLSALSFDTLTYYRRATDEAARTWDDVPSSIKETFERLGVPEAERQYLGGVGAQFDSEVVYHTLKEDLAKQGVVFLSMDEGVQKFPELVQQHYGTVVSIADNKFAALNAAVWSGGSFVYVPPGVEVTVPLQAYFRINGSQMGQFERTLIIADRQARVHYVEGCTAPIYSRDSLHAAVVEVVAREGSRVRYTTIQNWSGDVYNLVTKRAIAQKNATVEWIDANLGSKVTMKYPCVILKEPGSRADILSLAYAGPGQEQDAGAKVIHLAPHTSSTVVSKSVSVGGGRSTYRGMVKVQPNAREVKVSVNCDALLLDRNSSSKTWPDMQLASGDVAISHEASVGQVSAEQLFYLQSRGLDEAEALTMIVNGFIEPFTKELPMEYAVEMNRLIQLEMEGSVG